MKRFTQIRTPLLVAWMAAFALPPAFAQVPVDENGNPLDAVLQDDADGAKIMPVQGDLTEAELEELVGPVALYPDDLLAIVLPASTYPLEIVQAARFLERLEDDPSLEPDEAWDESVVALLNYPDVVRMLDENIDWTWKLGEAVIAQQTDVIAAVESFRDRAYAAGNLKSDEYQTVTYDDGNIEIEPVSDEIIYVPYYEPAEVVVYQPRRVYYYYPDPCPVYYYPYPAGYRFRSGYFWGVTTAFTIGWSNRYLHVYHPSYWGHPYYGRSYFGHWYRRPSITIYNNWYVNNAYRHSRYRYRDGDYWRPRYRSGSRPYEPRVRNYHYPPGSSQRDRDIDRSRVRVRDDGRMNLDLRDRDDARARSNADRQVRITSNGNARTNDRGVGRDRNARVTTNRSGENARVGIDRDRPRATTGTSNRSPRETSARDGIRFRDRSDDRGISRNNQRGNTRSLTNDTRSTRAPSSGSIRVAPRQDGVTTAPPSSRPNVGNSRNSTRRDATPRPRATGNRSNSSRITTSRPPASVNRPTTSRSNAARAGTSRSPASSVSRPSQPRISNRETTRRSAPASRPPRVDQGTRSTSRSTQNASRGDRDRPRTRPRND